MDVRFPEGTCVSTSLHAGQQIEASTGGCLIPEVGSSAWINATIFPAIEPLRKSPSQLFAGKNNPSSALDDIAGISLEVSRGLDADA